MRTGLGGAAIAILFAVSCTSDDGADRGETEVEEPGAAAPVPPLRVVTLNLLHGLFCPAETDACQAPDRVQIFTELVEQADCPDVIGLQEIAPRLEELLPAAVATLCDGEYEITYVGANDFDNPMILTRVPVLDRGSLDIANFPWDAYWVRVDSSLGPVDLLNTHFASSSNNPPCAPDRCPPICPPGMITNECHAAEVADFFAQRPQPAALSIASGDLNATPGSPTLDILVDAGFLDAWLEAGNAECSTASPDGCTGGGNGKPEPYVGIDTEEGPGFDERIDYVMVKPGPDCDLAVAAEGFATEPRSEALNGLWWPSDHAGLLAELRCDREDG